jgi:hypothetical protein
VSKPDLMTLARRIWTQPRAVIREVVTYDASFGQREILLTLSGVSGLLALHAGLEMMVLEIILNLILLVLSIYSMAVLLWMTGKPMGGKATIMELCSAMTWPMIPAIWGTLLTIPLLNAEPWGDVLQGLLYLYSFHIMIQTVAEVQEFSAWRSFFNQLFAFILSVLPILYFWQDIVRLFSTLTGTHF